MANDPHTGMPSGDQQWPPAEGPAGGPHDGEQPEPTDEAPLADRLKRDPGNLGNDVPTGGDVAFPAAEPSTPHM